MRKLQTLVVTIAILVLTSCTSDPRIQVISDKEQILNGTRIDLKLKVKEFEELLSITAQDSLDTLLPRFEKLRLEKIEMLEEAVQSYLSTITEYKEKLAAEKHESLKKLYQRYITTDEINVERTREIITIYNTDCKTTFLEKMYSVIKEYEADPSKILARKVKCTYKINNPMLNNVEQELTKFYWFSPDGKVILTSQKVDA